MTEENSIENLLDVSQLISSPYPLAADTMSQFKISALRYCCKILKKSHHVHKHLMVNLKLSDLY